MPYFPINEIFLSIQGEGYFAGQPALFIRLQGCDAGCHYCDTKYAWSCDDKHKIDSMEEIIAKREPSEKFFSIKQDVLMNYINAFLPLRSSKAFNHIVITGGEPFSHEINRLVNNLILDGYYVQIETSGRYEIPVKSFAWITLSPKQGCLESSYRRCNEIKFIVTDGTDFDYIRKIKHRRKYLQPESCRPEMVKLTTIMATELNCRVSIQMHKYLDIR